MTLKKLPLPPLKLAERQTDSHITLQCFVTLDVPTELGWITSASDLSQAVVDEQLWIAKKEASFVNVSMTSFGEDQATGTLQILEHRVKDFEVSRTSVLVQWRLT
jgi:thymidylate synthase ThyX